MKPEYFDVSKYRKDIADEIRDESDREKRKAILFEKKESEKYSVARDATVIERNVDMKTRRLFTPEKLDLLTSLIKETPEGDNREDIFKKTLEELIFEMAISGSDEWQGELDKYMEANIRKRERMLENIGYFIEDQDRLTYKLRSHQLEALIKIKDFIEAGYLRGYVAHPTGAGKTMLFSSLIKATEARTLIVVPTKLLVKQTLKELRKNIPVKKLSFICSSSKKNMNKKDEDDENDEISEYDFEKGAHGDVVVTTDESFILDSANMREERFDFIIEDEAHNSYTSKAQHALRYFPDAIKLAFTATPDAYCSERKAGFIEVPFGDTKLYLDPEKMASRYYPHEIDRISLKEAIEMEMLVGLHYAQLRVEMNLDEAQVSNTKDGLDFNEQSLEKLLEKHWPTLKDQVIKSYFEGVKSVKGQKEETLVYKDKQIFAVCSSVEKAEDLAREFNERGIKAECVTGETSDDDRNKIFKRYRKKETQILTSVRVLKEGWDAPEAEVCLMLLPTLSRTFYEQVLGRVLRLDPNNPKKKALAIDFLGRYKRFTPMTAAGLFGINEFYNGQLLVPKKKEVIEKDKSSFEEEEESPYNVSTILQKIERVEKPTMISDKLLMLGNDFYCTMAFLEENFHIKHENLHALLAGNAIASIKVGKANFLNAKEIVGNIISNGEIFMYRRGFLPMKDISMELRLGKNYLDNLARNNGIAMSWETDCYNNEHEVFDGENLWRLVKKELEAKLFDISNLENSENHETEIDRHIVISKKKKFQRDKSKILTTDELVKINSNSPEGALRIMQHVLNQENINGANSLLSSINILRKLSDSEEKEIRELLDEITGRFKKGGIPETCRGIIYAIENKKRA
jgi:superfamily II DNA or RNA helicase